MVVVAQLAARARKGFARGATHAVEKLTHFAAQARERVALVTAHTHSLVAFRARAHTRISRAFFAAEARAGAAASKLSHSEASRAGAAARVLQVESTINN